MKAHLRQDRPYKTSACTIAKNEAENIARSIESYRDFVDEVIVVDTGSTDDTVRIAQEHGATVLHFDWCDDFSAAKNFALDHAVGDWIVFLDADEYFCEECGQRVHEAIAIAEQRGHNAIGCRMKNIEPATGELHSEIFQIRIFKSEFRYQNPIHEAICSPNGLSLLSVHETWFFLYHTGYSVLHSKSKAQRNLELLNKKMETETDPKEKAFLHAYLADTYYSLGELNNTISNAKLYIEGRNRYGAKLMGIDAKVYLVIIWTLEALDAPWQKIDRWVRTLEEIYPNYPDSSYCRARVYMRRRMFGEASKKMDEANRLSAQYDDEEIDTVKNNQNRMCYLRGLCVEGLGDPADAFDWYVKAMHASGGQPPMARLLWMVKKQPPQEIKTFVRSLFQSMDVDRRKNLMAGLMSNYMADVLLLCYAQYHISEEQATVDANVSAFIQAGRGDYAGAASLFTVFFGISHDPAAAMRALVCAVLSGDEQMQKATQNIARVSFQAVLGVSDAPLSAGDVSDIALLVAEAGRLKGDAYAAALAETAVRKLGAWFAKELAFQLEQALAFDAALAVVRFAPLTPETLFQRGYYLLRTGQPGLAQDCIRLSQSWGCAEEAADELLQTAARQLERARADAQVDAGAELAHVVSLLEAGDFEQAWAQLCALRTLAEPDAQWYSAAAAALYYLGRDEQAALIAQAGLYTFADDTDLHVNTGDIFARMGRAGEAQAHYAHALDLCGDGPLRTQICTALAAVSAS